MLFVASPLLLLTFFLCVSSLLVWLVCVFLCLSLGLFFVIYCASWTWLAIFFSMMGKFSIINLFKNCLMQFRFLFFSWEPWNSNFGAFDMVPDVSETVLSSLHSLYFFCYSEVISTILSSSSLIHSSASDTLLFIPSTIFLISVILLFLKMQVRWFGIPISFRIFHSLLWSTQPKALA